MFTGSAGKWAMGDGEERGCRLWLGQTTREKKVREEGKGEEAEKNGEERAKEESEADHRALLTHFLQSRRLDTAPAMGGDVVRAGEVIHMDALHTAIHICHLCGKWSYTATGTLVGRRLPNVSTGAGDD